MAEFHADRILDAIRRPADSVAPVIQSWRRCVETYGLNPHGLPRPIVLSTTEVADFRRPIDDLVSLARDEVDRLFLRLRDHGYVVTLADGGGVTLLMRCAETQLEACRATNLLIGSVWSEESQGTNGIGTCITQNEPVSIVMGEHFSADLVNLSCTVAPIFGAPRQVASVLNVTTDRPTDHAMQTIVRDIVRRSARRIENHYFMRRHAGRRVLRLSRHEDFSDLAWEDRIALDDDGLIVDATPGALKLLADGGKDPLGRPAEDVLGVRLREAGGEEGAARAPGARFFVRAASPAPAPRRPLPAGPAPQRQPAAPTAAEIDTLLGHDPVMLQRVQIAQKLINRRLPVLLQGETGTGKSSLAKLLHRQSTHAGKAFVSLNCAAIPPDLIESELFGYRPGAFTGASRTGSRGRLLDADGGTLFLDEIGDMPMPLQTRLLHVLSDGEFVPVGGSQAVKVQVAVISASLHDIASMVRAGRFREDLYYRLNGATLALPALRQRADRKALFESVFQDECAQVGLRRIALDPAVTRILEAYHWPGNIRELRHVARYAATLAEDTLITPDLLPPPFDSPADASEAGQGEAVDRKLLLIALEQARWNVSSAAKRLGMSRTTLHRKLRQLGIRRNGES
ncbi:MAG: sigma-54-dependent Fis family transcriptional regulator [Alsobacter sp.]